MTIITNRPTDWDTLNAGDILKLVSQQYSVTTRYVLIADVLVTANGDVAGYDCWVLKPSRYSATSELAREYIEQSVIIDEFQTVTPAELNYRWAQARCQAAIAVSEAEIALMKAKANDGAFAILADEVWDVL